MKKYLSILLLLITFNSYAQDTLVNARGMRSSLGSANAGKQDTIILTTLGTGQATKIGNIINIPTPVLTTGPQGLTGAQGSIGATGVTGSAGPADSSKFYTVYDADTSRARLNAAINALNAVSGVSAGTYEFVTVNLKGVVTGGYNSVLNTLAALTFGTAYRASDTTRIFDIDATVKIQAGASLISTSDGVVTLDVSPNGTTGWVEYARSQNGNSGILNSVNAQSSYVEAKSIPAGYRYRFNTTTTTGTVTYLWIIGHENLRK